MRIQTDTHLTGPALDVHVKFDQEIRNDLASGLLEEFVTKAALAFADAKRAAPPGHAPSDHDTVATLRAFFRTLSSDQIARLAAAEVLSVDQVVLLTQLWEAVDPVPTGPKAGPASTPSPAPAAAPARRPRHPRRPRA